jgi:8-oxo-dGTP pyrophosphatase MutT (NUDIX family)
MREKSCGAIIINDNKVLIIKQHQGFYSFPKGHVEQGESEIETAKREVKEETNLDIEIFNNYRYVITYQVKENILKDVVYFIASAVNISDTLPQEEEVSEIRWVTYNEALELLTYHNLKELLIKVYNDLQIPKS